MGLGIKKVFKKIKFGKSQYLEGEDKKLRPTTPTKCPYREDGDCKDCEIFLKDIRDRKTGPSHPIHVYGCRIHKHFFTVYPHGFTPFGRKLIWLVGETISVMKKLVRTYFDAPIDGVNSIKWPIIWYPQLFEKPAKNEEKREEKKDKNTEGLKEIKGSFKTQKRHIDGLCCLFGIDKKSDDSRLRHISDLTGLSILNIRDAFDQQSRDGPRTYKSKSVSLESLLSKTKNMTLNQMLRLGSLVDYWADIRG